MSTITNAQSTDRIYNGEPFPAPGTYAIDVSHSSVGATVRHLVVSKVRGNFTEFGGTVVVGDGPADSSVEVTIAAKSIQTRDEKRDGHLVSEDFLDADNHPELTFRSTRVQQAGKDWKVVGDLTIRGITREVVLDTEYQGSLINPWGSTVAVFSATTKLNREDFGMTWNAALESGGVLVSKDLSIELEIEAVRQEG